MELCKQCLPNVAVLMSVHLVFALCGFQSITAGHIVDIFSSNKAVNRLNDDCITVFFNSNENITVQIFVTIMLGIK